MPPDFDGDEGAGAVLGEEGVDGFEEQGFPAGDHLGNVGVEAGGAVEVEDLAVEGVGALDGDVGAGNAEVERGEGELAGAEGEGAAHVGGDIGGGRRAGGVAGLGGGWRGAGWRRTVLR